MPQKFKRRETRTGICSLYTPKQRETKKATKFSPSPIKGVVVKAKVRYPIENNPQSPGQKALCISME